MPWSLKASGLIKRSYSAVAAAGVGYFHALSNALEEGISADQLDTGGVEILNDLRRAAKGGLERIDRFRDAYRRYCWEVDSLKGIQVAPFHILGSDQGTFFLNSHSWHMQRTDRLHSEDPEFLSATRWSSVNLADPVDLGRGAAWWEDVVNDGGEGAVAKPASFIHRNKGRLVQPAVKCRGKDYLRLVYGPEYDKPASLARLRQRSLERKRIMAVKQFSLGVEALERFVAGKGAIEVHKCILGILAIGNESTDPRL
jgi:protein phosphatase